MSKYHIDFCEEKQTKIGPILEAQVTDESGVQTDKVALFPSNWPDWKTFKPGSDVLGELRVKQNGKFTNKTLYPEMTNTLNRPRTAPAWAKGATTAAKITSESVQAAQSRKEASIEKTAAIRDSTLITVALINAYAAGKIIDIDEVKKDWRNWRKFFEGEFEDPGVPFD